MTTYFQKYQNAELLKSVPNKISVLLLKEHSEFSVQNGKWIPHP